MMQNAVYINLAATEIIFVYLSSAFVNGTRTRFCGVKSFPGDYQPSTFLHLYVQRIQSNTDNEERLKKCRRRFIHWDVSKHEVRRAIEPRNRFFVCLPNEAQ